MGGVLHKLQHMLASPNKMGGVLQKIQISFPIFTSTYRRIAISMYRSRCLIQGSLEQQQSVSDVVIEHWLMCHNLPDLITVRAKVKSLLSDTIVLG